MIEHGGTEQNLRFLTLRDGPQLSDWDNPWGAVKKPSRIFQATRNTDAGNHEPNVCVRQLRGPSETLSEQFNRQKVAKEAKNRTEAYLDAIPPSVLHEMIEANSNQLRCASSGIQDPTYKIQTGGWDSKLAEYEERWRKSSGLLPMLESQLQKRKGQGWKLWDMPLMQSDAGSEEFLYDRMVETGAET